MTSLSPLRSGLLLATTATALLLASCRDPYSPDSYAPGAVQQASKVDRAVITSERTVDVGASGLGSGIGAGAGAAAGGIGGSQAGSGGGNAIATLGGVLIGGLIGLVLEHAIIDTQATEYILRKDNGDMMSVTQKDKQPLAAGQRVFIIYGVQARIVPDQSGVATAAPPAK